MATYKLTWSNGKTTTVDNLSSSAISYYQNTLGVKVEIVQDKVDYAGSNPQQCIPTVNNLCVQPKPTRPLDPRSPTYAEDYKAYINSLTKYDALRIVAGTQERPTDTQNVYIQKSTGVETTQCTTCNLDTFIKERGYTLEDLNRPSNDPFWNIFEATKYTDLREVIKEREILLDAGIKADLDLTSAESFNNYLDKLPTYRAELDDIKKNERQQSSFSLESLLGSFSSSPTINDTQTNLLGGNQQKIETQDSITTQEQIVRDPLGSSLSIGSGLAIGLGVLVVGSLLNKRK